MFWQYQSCYENLFLKSSFGVCHGTRIVRASIWCPPTSWLTHYLVTLICQSVPKSNRVFPGLSPAFWYSDTHSTANHSHFWWFEAVAVPRPTCHAKWPALSLLSYHVQYSYRHWNKNWESYINKLFWKTLNPLPSI